jgi:hypothetical protein
MQTVVTITINGVNYPALMRRTGYGVALKLANGKPTQGAPLATAESEHLAEHPEKIAAFLRGEVVKC